MNEFTLHGLWPSHCNGSEVKERCDRDRELDDVENRLKQSDFFKDMKKYWPSFLPIPQQPNNKKFWKHEWNKHGTCVTTLDTDCGYDVDQGLYAYFNTTLALRKQYNIYDALEKAGITPRPRFDMEAREEDRLYVDKLLAAIQRKWNVTAAVHCPSNGDPLE
ncbi:ribonuclease T2-like, partial [Mortierella antarctica]